MSFEEFATWISENQQGYNQRHHANGIDWRIIEMKDGWFAIFRINYDSQLYIPTIQAKDLPHALSYIELTEPVTVPMQKLC